MPTFAGQASQAFPHRAIEAFNKGRIQFASSHARLKQLLCVLKRSQRHLAADLDDVVFLHAFDHRPRPTVFFTFSRNARLILLGYAAHPSVHTSKAPTA